MFNEKGYLDFNYIMKDKNIFIFIVGGRGSGKTYGAIEYALLNNKKFLFMRRTQTQIDLIKDENFSPFKAIDKSICVHNINKNLTGIYRGEYDANEQRYIESGAPIGYMCALSTISNIRGFDASDVELIIYDEFIGEAHERVIKNEGQAFLNAYETINRNRELNGDEPVKVIALANSNMLANPLFIELELVTPVEKMMNTGNTEYKNFNRGVSVYMVNKSPVLDKKQKTALYRLTGENSEFYNMALRNRFTAEELDHIETQDLKQYKLICTVGELAIYKHKSMKIYYINNHKSGTTDNNYSATPMDLKRFKRDQYFLWLAYLGGRILFESYIYKVLFEKYFDIT